MKLISCSACGSNDVVEDNGVFVCAFCQSRYLNDSGAASHAGPVTLEVIKTEFDVVLQDPGRNKIGVINAVQKLNGSGLKQAKELVESTPPGCFKRSEHGSGREGQGLPRESGRCCIDSIVHLAARC